MGRGGICHADASLHHVFHLASRDNCVVLANLASSSSARALALPAAASAGCMPRGSLEGRAGNRSSGDLRVPERRWVEDAVRGGVPRGLDGSRRQKSRGAIPVALAISLMTGLPLRMAACKSANERTRALTATGKASRSPLDCNAHKSSPADPAAGTRAPSLAQDITSYEFAQ
eukprot:3103176-Amphidinium_carterae.2